MPWRSSTPEKQLPCECLITVFIPATIADPETLDMFVDLRAVTDFVAVVSFVKPWDKTKFLYHLCLTLGHYMTQKLTRFAMQISDWSLEKLVSFPLLEPLNAIIFLTFYHLSICKLENQHPIPSQNYNYQISCKQRTAQ